MIKKYSLIIACIIPLIVHAQNEYDFSAVDQLLSDSMRTISGLGGGCGFILIKDNEIVFEKSYGLFYSTNKIVPIASATKWLSAGVIMSLVDDGLISLDDSLNQYLPQFKGEKGRITIRQMFSHTSGLPAQSPFVNDKSMTLAQAVDSIANNVELEISPGTGFIYGGVSMHIAGRIAEIVTGKSWATLFFERISQPLEMGNTDYNGLGVTENYRIAGGAQSSAREYANFLQMIKNNGVFKNTRVLSQQAIHEMQKDQTFGVPLLESPFNDYVYLDSTLQETRYGIGLWIERKDTASGESSEISSPGAFGFSPWIDLERNVIGILSVRSLLPKVVPTYLELKKLIRTAIDSVSFPSSIEIEKQTVNEYSLFQNFPNPFNLSTTIKYNIQKPNWVIIKVYNLAGQEIETLVNEYHYVGSYTVPWHATGIPSAVYYYTLQTGGPFETKKLILLK
jgi:serine-type D-Ala-D-Ala carboxypeptidase/endopeptidase